MHIACWAFTAKEERSLWGQRNRTWLSIPTGANLCEEDSVNRKLEVRFGIPECDGQQAVRCIGTSLVGFVGVHSWDRMQCYPE